MKYELVMGLEVHCELATNSKLFCTCSAKYGADQNENICPACSGFPGLLPVANKRAVELGILAGLVTNSEITRTITFDKKNYFYPDLSTGHQITQWFAPICRNGYVDIKTEAGERRINLKQIHIEEDAGKLVHDFRTETSLVDYNRASVPLVEIVSKPDFRSAEEVVAYLEKLRSLLTFAGVSDCKMQEGSMRCDVNISVREAGSDKLGIRTEIKNMNSLKAIARAIEYEYQRHVEAIETGCEELVQETRRWDDNKGESFSMRNKEDATDYRYFPNPDIMPIVIDDEWLEEVKASLPESAEDKFNRLTSEYAIPEKESGIITDSKNISDMFDEVMKYYNSPKDIVNWIIVDLFALAKNENILTDDIKIDCEKFAKLIELVNKKTVNRNVGKTILAEIFKNNVDPQEYIEKNNLAMVSDDGLIREVIAKVIAANPKGLADYKNGNPKAAGFFVGQIMRETKGKADPRIVNEMLMKMLDEA